VAEAAVGGARWRSISPHKYLLSSVFAPKPSQRHHHVFSSHADPSDRGAQQNKVIPLPPEFIVPQDGHAKQDCENAAKRWLHKYAATYRVHNMTILGDDLYATRSVRP
jgi:hypothetical protein